MDFTREELIIIKDLLTVEITELNDLLTNKDVLRDAEDIKKHIKKLEEMIKKIGISHI